MKKLFKIKKGFTLIEILMVITILTLIVLIAIPGVKKLSKNINYKLYTTKIELASQSGVLWGEDHQKCFKCEGSECDNIPGCEELNCPESYNTPEEKICEVPLEFLAEENYFDYDDKENKIITDPTKQRDSLNDTPVLIVYNKVNAKISGLDSADFYYITFNDNGATSGKMNTKLCKKGEECSLPTNNYLRDNHTFLGWSQTPTGNVVYNPSVTKVNLSSNTILYAKWDIYKYDVEYLANQGSNAPAKQIKTHDTPLTLTNATPTRTCYVFNSWNTNSSGTGTRYNSGQTYNTNADLILYAQWTPATYTITYNANGGSGAPASQTKNCGVDLTLSTTTPYRTGYLFEGWTSSSGTNYSAGSKFTVDANTTLTARWYYIPTTTTTTRPPTTTTTRTTTRATTTTTRTTTRATTTTTRTTTRPPTTTTRTTTRTTTTTKKPTTTTRTTTRTTIPRYNQAYRSAYYVDMYTWSYYSYEYDTSTRTCSPIGARKGTTSASYNAYPNGGCSGSYYYIRGARSGQTCGGTGNWTYFNTNSPYNTGCSGNYYYSAYTYNW